MVRVHQLRYAPLSFNPSPSEGRFRPIVDSHSALVPSLYGADSADAAIAETLFHELPISATPKHLARVLVNRYALATLRPRRELELVQLHGHGVHRLGVTHGTLIECGPSDYPATAAWGQAAYDHESRTDGIVWISRQFPGGRSLLLFGDRCGGALELVAGSELPLGYGRGFAVVCAAALKAGVVIVES